MVLVVRRKSNPESACGLLKEGSGERGMFVGMTGAPAIPRWSLCIPVLVLQS